MTVCPRCSYSLVLLEKRCRYKCAKCGRLFLQKPIEDIEFRRWNQKQREIIKEETEYDFEGLWKAYKSLHSTEKPKQQKPVKEKRPKLTEEEKKQKKKKYYQNNKTSISQHKKQYYQQNKDNIISKRKEWYYKNTEKARERMKQWAINNRELIRRAKMEYYHKAKKRINTRNRLRYGLKKAFALQTPENDAYKPDNPNSPSQMADFYLFNYCLQQNV